MSFFHDFFSNRYITIPALAWMIAQISKVLWVVIKQRKFDIERFVGSGGMPSSHSSFIVSLTTVIGKNHGWDSALFGIAFAVSLIVMYDAAGVRRAAGKQAKVLNELIFSHKIKIDSELKELLGHSPLEVAMGAVLGVFLGIWLG